jgi:hypothetical protein
MITNVFNYIRKRLPFAILLFVLNMFSSCVDDKSTMSSIDVNDIEVSGIQNSYTIISHAGNVLNISPTISSNYTDLEYTWTYMNEIYDENNIKSLSDIVVKIADTKDLNYPINLPVGTYRLVFTAKSKNNGYSVTSTSNLIVQTEFSRGFFMLKETADGNTELDMESSSGKFYSNLITAVYGAPFTGKPKVLNSVFGQCFMVNESKATGNTLFITYGDKDFRFLNTSDLSTVIDRNNLSFGSLDSNDIPYTAGQSVYSVYYIASSGPRSVYASAASKNTGRFGESGIPGGSKHLVINTGNSYAYYWNETEKGFYYDDYNGNTKALSAAQGTTYTVQGLTGYECLKAGRCNMLANPCVFILKDNSGKRYIYEINAKNAVAKVTNISSTTNLASADIMSINENTATYVYSINGRKLFAYNLNDGTEQELSLSGIASNEEITFLLNSYWTDPADVANNFNYLAIGTQSGNNYKIYFYSMVGGQPNGNPVKTISGVGKLKAMRYVSPTFKTNKTGGITFPIQN